MKNAKRILAIALLGCFNTLSIIAQQKASDKMFNDFRSREEVTYLSFSKNLIDFVDLNVDNDEGEYEIKGDLHEVKLAIFKPNDKPANSFADDVRKYMKKGNYTMVEEKDLDDDSEVWIHRKGKKVYECHVIFQGDKNSVLLSFFGEFRIKDIEMMKKKIEDYK